MSIKKTSPPRRPEFRFEIKGGKITLQTSVLPAIKLWKLILTILLVVLIVLAILRPEGWLDILRVIMLVLQMLFAGGRGGNSRPML